MSKLSIILILIIAFVLVPIANASVIDDIIDNAKPLMLRDVTPEYSVYPNEQFDVKFNIYSFNGASYKEYRHKLEIRAVDNTLVYASNEIQVSPGQTLPFVYKQTSSSTVGTYTYKIINYAWMSTDGGNTGKWINSGSSTYNVIVKPKEPFQCNVLNSLSVFGSGNCTVWTIKVYYITQNNIVDMNWETILQTAMVKGTAPLTEYDGTQFKWNIEKVNVPSWIYIRPQIGEAGSWSSEISYVANSIPGFENSINNYNMIFIVFAGTRGGAYALNYKSPIFWSYEMIKTPAPLTLSHEYMHTFGLKDVMHDETGYYYYENYPTKIYTSPSQVGCLMYDTTATKVNLCEFKDQYKLSNYKKQTFAEITEEWQNHLSNVPESYYQEHPKKTIDGSPFQIITKINNFIDSIFNLFNISKLWS